MPSKATSEHQFSILKRIKDWFQNQKLNDAFSNIKTFIANSEMI